jgi:hypothetical protein
MNTCKNCGNPTKNPNYCSRSCSAKSTNKAFPKRKTARKCIVCGDSVASYRNSRCPVHHNEYMLTRFDYIKELTLEEYQSKDSLKNLHPSSKNVHIRLLARTHFKDLRSKPCANCGYDKHVELCHIKPIREFSLTSKIKDINSYDNLIQLCPNCHWEFDNGLLSLPERIPTSTLTS